MRKNIWREIKEKILFMLVVLTVLTAMNIEQFGVYATGTGAFRNLNKKEREDVLSVAKSKLGSPYVWGANGPESFDCTGFVTWVYLNSKAKFDWAERIGVSRPTTASYNNYMNTTTEEKVVSVDVRVDSECNKLEPGALIIMYNKNTGEPEHAGIYYGKINGVHKMIHAGYNTENGKEEVSIVNLKETGDKHGISLTPKVKVFNFEGSPKAILISKKDSLTSNVLKGATFQLYNDKDCTDRATNIELIKVSPVTTDSNGTARIENLKAGTYYLKETRSPAGYKTSTKAIKVVVEEKHTTETPIEVNIENDVLPAKIKLTKTGSDLSQPIPGVVFEVRFSKSVKAKDGTIIYKKDALADTITTNNSGEAVTSNLYPAAYYVQELKQGANFKLNTTRKNITLSADQIGSVTMTNDPVLGSIAITKKDKETAARPQGDASLAGAVYKLYAKSDIKSANTVVWKAGAEAAVFPATDKEGNAAITASESTSPKRLYMGEYYVKEFKPSPGYLLDTAEYPVTLKISDRNPGVAVNAKKDVLETIIKAPIKLHKSLLPGSYDDHRKPLQDEANAKFQIYLKRAGSYKKACETERDELVTGTDGYAKSRPLPYGTYIVTQTDGAKDYEFITDFEVEIRENGAEKTYTLVNPVWKSQVMIEKYDTRTQKTIQIGGVKFRIYKKLQDGTEELLELGSMKQSMFETSTGEQKDGFGRILPAGTLLLPDYLDAGEYLLEEAEGYSPEGYILDSKLIPFTVSRENVDAEAKIIVVRFGNDPVKGELEVYKEGEQLVSYKEGKFQYESLSLAGCEFIVYAKEAVYTPDRQTDENGKRIELYKKDEEIAVIQSDENGKANLRELPLGEYYLKETKVPEGYLISNKVYEVNITFKGGKVAIVTEAISIKNERQRLAVEVVKNSAVEKEKKLAGAEFTIKAREEIVNYKGEVIVHKGAVVDVITSDISGRAYCKADLPLSIYASPTGDKNAPLFELEETKAPEGYFKNVERKELIDASVPEQTVILKTEHKEFENEPTKVRVKKISEKSAKFVKSAKLEIKDSEGKKITSWTTEEKGHIIYGLLPGKTYTLIEKETPAGYVTAKAITFTVKKQSRIQTVSMTDAVTKMKISKKDITNKKELPGARLQVKDKNGRIVEKWISKDTPHYIEMLPAGKYTLVETTAPEGYAAAEEVKFEVKETAAIQHVEIYDKPLTKVPKTGDDISLINCLVFLAVSSGGFVFVYLLKKYKLFKKR